MKNINYSLNLLKLGKELENTLRNSLSLSYAFSNKKIVIVRS